MTILWSNNASTTVSGSITATSTSVALAAGTGIAFPNPTGGNYFVATFYDQATKTQNEIVHVTARSGDTCTIARGQEGTTPQAWNAGDIFANLVTAGTLEAFVQAGTGPADTSVVYVGTDVSTTPGHIVCPTNPVPPNYAIGMLFNIKVNNTNPGPTDCAFNGQPAIIAKRTDGSDLVGGNTIAGQEYIFIYNGTYFQTTIPPIPAEPPQTIFYVRTDGNDSNSGFANTPSQAFQTIQGAVNQIKARYISQNTITVRVNDGTYTSGMADDSQYIAAWNFVGNTTNPQNVVINATSTNSATYVPGAPAGTCVSAGKHSNFAVSGFSFVSLGQNVTVDGYLDISICNFTSPTNGKSALDVGGGGICYVHGNNNYSATNAVQSVFIADNGQMIFGSYDPVFGSSAFVLNINTSVTCSVAFIVVEYGGVVSAYDNVMGFTYGSGVTVTGPQFYTLRAGGIAFWTSNTNVFPGSLPGIVGGASSTDCGGWLSHG